MRPNAFLVRLTSLILVLGMTSMEVGADESNSKSEPALKKVEEIKKKMSSDTKKQKIKKQELAPSKKKPDVIVIP